MTCSEQTPADEVQVVLRPAARIADRVTGQVADSGRYFLVLLDRADRELRVSVNHYDWDEVLKLAGLFRGKNERRALEWWGRKFPSGEDMAP